MLGETTTQLRGCTRTTVVLSTRRIAGLVITRSEYDTLDRIPTSRVSWWVIETRRLLQRCEELLNVLPTHKNGRHKSRWVFPTNCGGNTAKSISYMRSLYFTSSLFAMNKKNALWSRRITRLSICPHVYSRQTLNQVEPNLVGWLRMIRGPRHFSFHPKISLSAWL